MTNLERAARVRVNGGALGAGELHSPHASDRRPVASPRAARAPLATRPVAQERGDLGHVIRDAIDHTTEIARDTVAIATLEARKTISQMGPRIAWSVLAAALGSLATAFALVALFLAAGVVIPSVAARLGLLALILFGIAALAARRAQRIRAG